MHAKIIQVSGEPIKRKDYIHESDLYEHWFLNDIADYIHDVPSQKRVPIINELLSQPGLKYKDDKLTVIDKNAYFRSNFERFKENIKTMNEWTLDDFSNIDAGYMIYKIGSLYEDKYGTYLYDATDSDMRTLDNWIRYAENGDVLYIGNVVDYHY